MAIDLVGPEKIGIVVKIVFHSMSMCFYLVYKQRYNYFRFGGRHFEFVTSADIGEFPL